MPPNGVCCRTGKAWSAWGEIAPFARKTESQDKPTSPKCGRRVHGGCGTGRNAMGLCVYCASRCTYLWSGWLMSKGRRSCVVGSSVIKTERSTAQASQHGGSQHGGSQDGASQDGGSQDGGSPILSSEPQSLAFPPSTSPHWGGATRPTPHVTTAYCLWTTCLCTCPSTAFLPTLATIAAVLSSGPRLPECLTGTGQYPCPWYLLFPDPHPTTVSGVMLPLSGLGSP